jgi:hypothetical protein
VATLETPEYAKFAKYHEKLSNWSAVSETWDIGEYSSSVRIESACVDQVMAMTQRIPSRRARLGTRRSGMRRSDPFYKRE